MLIARPITRGLSPRLFKRPSVAPRHRRNKDQRQRESRGESSTCSCSGERIRSRGDRQSQILRGLVWIKRKAWTIRGRHARLNSYIRCEEFLGEPYPAGSLYPLSERFMPSRSRVERIFQGRATEGTNFQTADRAVTFERSRYNHSRDIFVRLRNPRLFHVSRTVRAMRYANETALSLKRPNRRY